MSKKVLISVLSASFLLLVAGVWLVTKSQAPLYTGLDDFAKCLSDKGLVMYGAIWCSHCQNNKKAFGESFQYIKYVECPKEPNVCLENGVQGYPTWILGDETKLEGEQSLENLSLASGCPLPESK